MNIRKEKIMGVLRTVLAALGGILLLIPSLEGVDFNFITETILHVTGGLLDLLIVVWSWLSKDDDDAIDKIATAVVGKIEAKAA